MSRMGWGHHLLSWIHLVYREQSASILMHRVISRRIKIGRGVRQGCPLSPLLFNIVIEMLAIAVRSSDGIKSVRTPTMEHKLALYADDTLFFFFSDPVSSPCELYGWIDKFSAVSGYRINELKSVIWGFGISTQLRAKLPLLTKAKWTDEGVKYLGVSLSKNLSTLDDLNLLPLFQIIMNQLANWRKFTLSWFGCLLAIKMRILPKILFYFHNVVMEVLLGLINKLQIAISQFIWGYGKPRIKAAILQKPVDRGGLAVPNFQLYYYAQQIGALMQWWSGRKPGCWALEQEMAKIPLSEVIFYQREIGRRSIPKIKIFLRSCFRYGKNFGRYSFLEYHL